MAGVITTLRDIVPVRPLAHHDALRIAELQALRLLKFGGITSYPVPETLISEVPRIQVVRMTPSPFAGGTQWSRGRWLIVLRGSEQPERQRFTLAHAFKHILDNPFISLLYPPIWPLSAKERRERICNYFAACLLMPRPWVKRAWGEGVQDVGLLAQRFEVSFRAMEVRLIELGLVEPSPRCGWTLAPSRMQEAA